MAFDAGSLGVVGVHHPIHVDRESEYNGPYCYAQATSGVTKPVDSYESMESDVREGEEEQDEHLSQPDESMEAEERKGEEEEVFPGDERRKLVEEGAPPARQPQPQPRPQLQSMEIDSSAGLLGMLPSVAHVRQASRAAMAARSGVMRERIVGTPVDDANSSASK
jgi:hypothetical protein